MARGQGPSGAPVGSGVGAACEDGVEEAVAREGVAEQPERPRARADRGARARVPIAMCGARGPASVRRARAASAVSHARVPGGPASGPWRSAARVARATARRPPSATSRRGWPWVSRSPVTVAAPSAPGRRVSRTQPARTRGAGRGWRRGRGSVVRGTRAYCSSASENTSRWRNRAAARSVRPCSLQPRRDLQRIHGSFAQLPVPVQQGLHRVTGPTAGPEGPLPLGPDVRPSPPVRREGRRGADVRRVGSAGDPGAGAVPCRAGSSRDPESRPAPGPAGPSGDPERGPASHPARSPRGCGSRPGIRLDEPTRRSGTRPGPPTRQRHPGFRPHARPPAR